MRPILTRLLREGMQNGEFRSDDPAEASADFLMVAVRGLVYNWCTHDGTYDLREAAERYVGALLRCISK